MRNIDPDRNGLVFKGRKSFLQGFNAAVQAPHPFQKSG
jgi:hypothetical protein